MDQATADQAKEKAAQAGTTAQEKAAGRAKGTLRDQVDRRSTHAGDPGPAS